MNRQKAVKILRRHWKINPRVARVYGYHDDGKCVLAVHELSRDPQQPGSKVKIASGASWLEALRRWVPERVIREA